MNYVKEFMLANNLAIGKLFSINNSAKYTQDKKIFYFNEDYNLKSQNSGVDHNSIMKMLLTGKYSITKEGGEEQMKAFVLMGLVAKNPKEYQDRIFKPVDGSSAMVKFGDGVEKFKISKDGRFISTFSGKDVYFLANAEVEEVKQQVPVLEAMEALHNNTDVYCEVEDCGEIKRFEYNVKLNKIGTLGNLVRNNSISAVSTKEILEGKWYIK